MGLNGWPTCNDSRQRIVRVPGSAVALRVERDLADILAGFAADYHRVVEPLHKGWCWGYACRPVRGRKTTSVHAICGALDLNAPLHALGADPTRSFSRKQIATIRALCKKWHLRWGGDYRGRKDSMHFEFISTPAQARALVAQLQKKPTAKLAALRAAAPKPTPPRLAKLKYGAKNSDIVKLQQRLNQLGYHVGTADGAYGPKTRAAVAAFQRHLGWHGTDADGHMGPHTLRELF